MCLTFALYRLNIILKRSISAYQMRRVDIIFNASVGQMEYIKINYGKAFWLLFWGYWVNLCCRYNTVVVVRQQNVFLSMSARLNNFQGWKTGCHSSQWAKKRWFYRNICSRNNTILLKFFCHSCGHEKQNGGRLFFFVSISSYQIGEENNNQIWSINQA